MGDQGARPALHSLTETPGHPPGSFQQETVPRGFSSLTHPHFCRGLWEQRLVSLTGLFLKSNALMEEDAESPAKYKTRHCAVFLQSASPGPGRSTSFSKDLTLLPQEAFLGWPAPPNLPLLRPSPPIAKDGEMGYPSRNSPYLASQTTIFWGQGLPPRLRPALDLSSAPP